MVRESRVGKPESHPIMPDMQSRIASRWVTRAVAGLVTAFSLASSLHAAEPTAFELINEANRYVGEQSKDKVVQIRSEKSVGSTSPNVWYLVFYDPTATLKATEVKLGAGKMLSVKRPMRLLEPVTGSDTPLDRAKLKVDSDQAIKVALEEPLLKNITVTSTKLKLERAAQGVLGLDSQGEAVWKIELWAARLRDSRKTSNIGEIWVSAGEAKVVRNDVRLTRLD